MSNESPPPGSEPSGARRMRRCRWAAAVLILVAVSTVQAAVTLLDLAVEDSATKIVVEDPTIVRQLSPVRFPGNIRTVEWLLDRPALGAILARRLHPPLERYQISPRQDGSFDVDDSGSLRGIFRLVAGGAHRRVYFCQGEFRSLAQLLNVSGGLVFTLEYREARDPSGRAVQISPQLHVRLDNAFARGTVKIVAPLLHGVIDRRVANLTTATQIMGERVSRDPEGLLREMQTWPEVRPEDLEEFRQAFLVERIHQ